MRPTTLLVLAALPLFASACVLAQTTDGQGLAHEELAAIVVGRSTRADVTQLLGAPDEIVYSNREHDPLFEQAYRYRRTRTRQTGLFLVIFSTYKSDTQWDHAIVFFDARGVVEHVGVRLDQESADYGLPF